MSISWLIFFCLTATQLKEAVCTAVCRSRGDDAGMVAKSGRCFCGRENSLEDLTEPQLKILPPLHEEPVYFYEK